MVYQCLTTRLHLQLLCIILYVSLYGGKIRKKMLFCFNILNLIYKVNIYAIFQKIICLSCKLN